MCPCLPQDVGRPSNRGTHYLYLERKVLQLMADNKSLALTLEQTVRRKDMQIAELQSHVSTVRGSSSVACKCMHYHGWRGASMFAGRRAWFPTACKPNS